MRFVWDRARRGISGASVEDVVEVEDRGWLVTVADRLGKYPVKGFGSIGESSGVVTGEEYPCGLKESSDSSGDCKDEVEDEDDAE